jgi:hypothetical protein
MLTICMRFSASKPSTVGINDTCERTADQRNHCCADQFTRCGRDRTFGQILIFRFKARLEITIIAWKNKQSKLLSKFIDDSIRKIDWKDEEAKAISRQIDHVQRDGAAYIEIGVSNPGKKKISGVNLIVNESWGGSVQIDDSETLVRTSIRRCSRKRSVSGAQATARFAAAIARSLLPSLFDTWSRMNGSE